MFHIALHNLAAKEDPYTYIIRRGHKLECTAYQAELLNTTATWKIRNSPGGNCFHLRHLDRDYVISPEYCTRYLYDVDNTPHYLIQAHTDTHFVTTKVCGISNTPQEETIDIKYLGAPTDQIVLMVFTRDRRGKYVYAAGYY